MLNLSEVVCGLLVVILSSVCRGASLNILTTDPSRSIVFQLGDITYYSSSIHSSVTNFSQTSRVTSPPPLLIPATSVHITKSHITQQVLIDELELYRALDDVWTPKFLDALVITYSGPGSAYLQDSALHWVKSSGISHLYLSGPNIQTQATEDVNILPLLQVDILPGPYLLSPSNTIFHQVYRLYQDDYDAFLFGSIPDPTNDGWTPTNITLPPDPAQHIPVPSRLHSMPATPARPLAGRRFALKDIFDARGLQTAGGSHAYARAHPPAARTAASVRRLLARGAVLVGKTMTTQFAHGAHPWECVDAAYPWSPRGDGYLTAGSSSAGSACALAGHAWLDFAVGSDTRGSVRRPAALVGAYGIRPSWGSMDLEGVIPLAEEMDTAGFFARDPALFCQIATLW